MLTLLPAVGGGTLRDLLVGGDRSPPFIFRDPAYMGVVLGVLIVGTVVSVFLRPGFTESRSFERFLAVFDTLGVPAFTVVGAQVALLAGVAWYWIPICAALTCAGGGMLLDVLTGREPRTFQGEPYEEIAVLGGLLLYLCLRIANHYEHSPWIVTASIFLTLAAVYAARMASSCSASGPIGWGMRSHRPGADLVRRRSSAPDVRYGFSSSAYQVG